MKIIFDRNKCIGAFSCIGVDDSWKPADDGKVSLEGSKETSPGIFEKEIFEKDLEKSKSAAAVCPVAAIVVEE